MGMLIELHKLLELEELYELRLLDKLVQLGDPIGLVQSLCELVD